MVRQILEDCEEEKHTTNEKLEAMGYNIGQRLIDEFLSKTNCLGCKTFEETGINVAKAFTMFFGVKAKTKKISS